MLELVLLPFRLVWSAVGLLFGLFGFLVSLVIGGLTLVIGLGLTVSIIGGFLGIPLMLLGLLLVLRAIF